MRHIITPEERGHRKPLSDTEKTKCFTIRLRESTHKFLRKAGSRKVRKFLEGVNLENL